MAIVWSWAVTPVRSHPSQVLSILFTIWVPLCWLYHGIWCLYSLPCGFLVPLYILWIPQYHVGYVPLSLLCTMQSWWKGCVPIWGPTVPPWEMKMSSSLTILYLGACMWMMYYIPYQGLGYVCEYIMMIHCHLMEASVHISLAVCLINCYGAGWEGAVPTGMHYACKHMSIRTYGH